MHKRPKRFWKAAAEGRQVGVSAAKPLQPKDAATSLASLFAPPGLTPKVTVLTSATGIAEGRDRPVAEEPPLRVVVDDADPQPGVFAALADPWSRDTVENQLPEVAAGPEDNQHAQAV